MTPLKNFTYRFSALFLLLTLSLSTSEASAQSPFANGKWVKIKVEKTGIQQITFEQLRQWGFDNPQNVTVYGYGGVAMANCWTPSNMPAELPQQYSLINNDRILFYGESGYKDGFIYRSENLAPGLAPVHNNASAEGYYFVTDSRNRISVTPVKYRYETTRILDNHTCVDLVDHNDEIPFNMGQNYYSDNILERPEKSISYTFPLTDRATSVSTDINVTNVVGASSKNPTIVRNYSTGTTIGTETFSLLSTNSELNFDNNYNLSSAYNFHSVDPSVDEFYYSISSGNPESTSWLAVYYTGIHYPRSNILRDSQMTMYFHSVDSYTPIRVTKTDDTSTIQVWRIDSSFSVVPFTTYDNGSAVIFTPDKNYEMATSTSSQAKYLRAIAFDPAATQYEVEYAGEVTDSGLYDEVPNLLIVTTDLCAPQAERLAQIHRDLLGHTVKVVKEPDIFNEFSSGTPAVNALRRYASWLYNRPNSEFRHILLFGATSTDLRGLNGTAAVLRNQGNLMLTYPTANHENQRSNIKSYTSDLYFGILDQNIDRESKFLTAQAQVNVGRISTQDYSKATEAVDKIYNYLSKLPTSDNVNRVLLLNDAEDDHAHLNNSEDICNDFLKNDPGMTSVKAYSSIYPRVNGSAPMLNAAISQALQMGVGMFNFSGHGRPDAFTQQTAWTLADVKNTNYNLFPIGVFATCDSYVFDQLKTSIAEEMVIKPNGGIIAAIGACRTVYQTRNQVLNREIGHQYSLATDATTTGDLFRTATNIVTSEYLSNIQQLTNDRCYNLCGDPALPLYTASRNCIAIETINSEPYNPEIQTNITALSPNEFKGVIYTNDGTKTIDESFNGEVIFTIYESPRYEATNDTPASINILVDEDQITSVKVPVTNGRFTLNLTTPMATRSAIEGYDYNRLTMLAISEDNLRRLKGYATNIKISRDYPEEIADTEAPTIQSFYIDSLSFKDGDAVEGSFTFHANIAPDNSGLRVSTGSIGGSIKIVVDGSRILPIPGSSISFNADGSADIALEATDFADGEHNAVLYVSDNSGNIATSDINFVVINHSGTAKLLVEESPARTQATLSLDHTYGGEPVARLIIEDINGNTVVSKENVTFPYEWDLTDGNTPVADGIYRAYTIFRSDNSYGATDKVDIIVVQKQ